MYLSHYGLSEPPFKITPHPDFFFDGANRGATLDALVYAVVHGEGMVKVSGEVGTGKTMLCRVLMEKLPDTVDIIYLANPSLSRDEILFTIADELSLDLAGQRQTAVIRVLQEKLIERYAGGRQVVVLIDEAHAMPLETLEEIRLLSNLESSHHKLLQMVLFGQPELNENLGLPHMRQLRERITHSFNLSPLSLAEVKDYLSFRMRAAGYKGPDVFTAAAVKALFQASRGLTRRINILADKCLLSAFAENTHGVELRHARAAIRDSEFAEKPRHTQMFNVLISAGIVGGIALAVGIFVGRQEPRQEIPPSRQIVSVAPAPTTPTKPSLAQRQEMTRVLLASEPGDHYTVQLMVADDPPNAWVESYIDRAGELLGLPNVYVMALPKQRKIDVLYGLYTSPAMAREALARLPLELRGYKPSVKSLAAVRSEAMPKPAKLDEQNKKPH